MRGAILLVALSLAACEREASFDDRYESAQEKIQEKATELDRELQKAGPAEPEPSDKTAPKSQSEN